MRTEAILTTSKGDETRFELKVQAEPINLTPSSSESFQLARGWFRNCLDTHPMCPKPTGEFMPKRVIEVLRFDVLSQNHSLRLCERLFENAEPYAALSYCWGTEGQIVTKLENIAQHLERIDTQLPATVTDALRVAIDLGIRYVWIDALCIIQDDFHDKTQQISQMPLVYAQATITIVASRTRCVQEGFLHERTSSQNLFKLPYRCRSGETSAVLLQPWIKPRRDPLDSRAWALQERLLSPRILEYGSFQTRWICQGNPEFQTPKDGFKTTSTYETISTTTKSQSKTKILEKWHSLVSAFGRRDLTLPTDRLPAISGIATHFSKFLGEYYAGLWKSYLWQELLWISDILSPPLAPRPKEFQAPSWSWAATNSIIKWMYVRDFKTDPSFEILDCQILVMETNQNMTSPEANKFGTVNSGSLVVHGHLQEAAWGPWWDGSGLRGGQLYIWGLKVPDASLSAIMHLDAIEKESASGERFPISVFLLKVAGYGSGGSCHVAGLVLRQIDSAVYSRLGVFEFSPGSNHFSRTSDQYAEQLRWLEETEPQTITII